MPFGARVSLSAGVLVLLLAAGNAFSAPMIDPSLQRAEVLAGMAAVGLMFCLLYTSPSPRDATLSRMPSSA